MKKYPEGLVIGKFYPPHLGHVHLITEALKKVDHLTVLAMGSRFDSISLETRCRMLSGIFGNKVTVKCTYDHVYDDYQSDAIWEAHLSIIKNHLDKDIDILFSSELYGDRLANELGAMHVCVDPSRSTVPISATKIREDVYGNWNYMHPRVRDFFRVDVVVMGGESTGTTTLSRDLQKTFANRGGIFASTPYVPEYGRDYAEKRIMEEGTRDLEWNTDHFWDISRGQHDLHNKAVINTDSPVIINDTDPLATEAFSGYYGVESSDTSLSDFGYFSSHVDIYFITDHRNMPLVDDGSRLLNKAARDASTQDFIDTAIRYDVPYALITGDRNTRLEVATKIIDNLLQMKCTLREPI